MAPERARFQGEPVAAVVATTPAIAADAVELVLVDYEPLPVVVDAVQSLKNGDSPPRPGRDEPELGIGVRMGRSRSGICRSRHDHRNRSAQIPSLFEYATGRIGRCCHLGSGRPHRHAVQFDSAGHRDEVHGAGLAGVVRTIACAHQRHRRRLWDQAEPLSVSDGRRSGFAKGRQQTGQMD